MGHFILWVLGNGLLCVVASGDPALALIDKNWNALPALADQSLRSRSSERLVDEAHLLLWKSKHTKGTDAKLELLNQAMVRVEVAREKAPREPRPLLYWAAVKGEMAQVKSKLVAITYIRPLEAAALELKAMAPTLRHCAADRILASLYHKAPSFVSIGDKEKAALHYQQMLEVCPDQPENEIFYAEFLLDQGDTVKARHYAEHALKSPKLKDFPIERFEWERMAKDVLQKAGEKSK